MSSLNEIENAVKAVKDVNRAQDKWKEKKRLFVVVWGLLGFAILNYVWAAIWCILWYGLWNLLEPKKFVEKLIKKSKK